MNRWRAWTTPLQQLYYSLAIISVGRRDQDVTVYVRVRKYVCVCVLAPRASVPSIILYYHCMWVCSSSRFFSRRRWPTPSPGPPILRHHLDECSTTQYNTPAKRTEITIINTQSARKGLCVSSYLCASASISLSSTDGVQTNGFLRIACIKHCIVCCGR